MTVGHYLFSHHCDGLLDAVRKASALAEYPYGHVWHDHEPYYGLLVGRAVWQARFCAHEARRLGLLEPEPVDVRVLVELDVLAGDPVEVE